MFIDRLDAGRQLAEKLKIFRNESCVILGVPRGGVPVANEISRLLEMPLDILPVKKIGHPVNKEYAIGAVGPEHEYIIPHADVSDHYIESEKIAVRKRLKEMQEKFTGTGNPTGITGKTAIIVDDGIATGNTIMAGIRGIREQGPGKIIVATPVISRQAYDKISLEADEVIILHMPDYFGGVGAFYTNFPQVSDEEVIAILNDNRGHATKS